MGNRTDPDPLWRRLSALKWGWGGLKIEGESCHGVTYTIGTGDSADRRAGTGRE